MSTSLLDVTAGLRACLFTVSGVTFALDVRSAREMAVFEAITPVPRAPAAVLGVANLRGDVVPIVDARARLGLPVRALSRPLRALVVAGDGSEIALVIDGVVGLEAFTEVTPPSEGETAAWAAGTVEHAGQRVTVLDAAALARALRGEE